MKRALQFVGLLALAAGVLAPFGVNLTDEGMRIAANIAAADTCDNLNTNGSCSTGGGGTTSGVADKGGPGVVPNKFVCIALPVLPGLSNCSAADAGYPDSKDPAGSFGVKLDNDPAKGGAIIVYLRSLLSLLSKAVGIVIMIMLVLAGVQYIASTGDASQVKAAKSRLQNALTALVLFLTMFAILTFIIPGGIL